MTLQRAALLMMIAAIGVIAGAYMFEYGIGLKPCPLCLMQRNPFYVAIPSAAAAAFFANRQPLFARLMLAFCALVMLVSAGLGTYHAGVEWHWWPGPTDCSGGAGALADVTDVLQSMRNDVVVRCDEAAWRFLGLSLAGWNVIVSFALAAFAAWAALLNQKPAYGSSSTSQ